MNPAMMMQLFGGQDDAPAPVYPCVEAMIDTLREKLEETNPKVFKRGDLVLFVDGMDRRHEDREHHPMLVVGMRGEVGRGPEVHVMRQPGTMAIAEDVLILSMINPIMTVLVWEDSRYLRPWTQEAADALLRRRQNNDRMRGDAVGQS